MRLSNGWLGMLLGAGTLFGQAPRHELAFTLGYTRSGTLPVEGAAGLVGLPPITLSSGTALQASYGYRVAGGSDLAVYVGAHFLANPQRRLASPLDYVTRDIASLYLVPDVVVKFRPTERVSPWVTAGGGYGLYEQSTLTNSGTGNPAARRVNRGVFLYGAGADVRLVRFLALRGEVRDFFTGTPAYNVALRRFGQHNVVIGGGFVLRF
jgi:opacity protein-like surface antigen